MPAILRPRLAVPFASRPPATAHRSPSPPGGSLALQSPRLAAAIVSANVGLPFYLAASFSKNRR